MVSMASFLPKRTCVRAGACLATWPCHPGPWQQCEASRCQRCWHVHASVPGAASQRQELASALDLHRVGLPNSRARERLHQPGGLQFTRRQGWGWPAHAERAQPHALAGVSHLNILRCCSALRCQAMVLLLSSNFAYTTVLSAAEQLYCSVPGGWQHLSLIQDRYCHQIHRHRPLSFLQTHRQSPAWSSSQYAGREGGAGKRASSKAQHHPRTASWGPLRI